MATDMMAGDMGAEEAPMAAAPTEDMSGGAGEQSSIFLSQSALGGRKVKQGDTLTLTVMDVDPETGDVQAELAGGGMGAETESGGYESDFEAAMPAEEA